MAVRCSRFFVRMIPVAIAWAMFPEVGAAQVITEFQIPTRASGPSSIVTGPDGNLWFTETTGDRIGRITPSGVITEFALPASGSFPMSIAVGSDGALWFTENGAYRIGRLTTSGLLTELPIPSPFPSGGPSDITSGPDGALWFTETNGGLGGRIRRVTTAGDFTLFPGPNPSQAPHQIVAGTDGNLWYSMPLSGKVGRITPAGVIAEFPLPSEDADALAIARGPDGNIWVAEHRAGGGRLGRVAPDGTITEVAIPSVTSSMFGLAAGPDGNLWFTETELSRIGRSTTGGSLTEIQLSSGSDPWGITAGPDGAMWFVENGSGKIGRAAIGTPGTCTSSATTMCLSNGRFRVTTSWRTANGTGFGQAVPLTSDSGYFWFFSANNIEMIVKTLDGCGLNSRFWVFAGGLTNVQVILTVTDTHKGTVKVYVNPINTAFQPIQDTAAFATCP